MPTKSQVHIDAALTNLSKAYRNAEYIAHKVLPVVPVMKDSDKYFVYGKEGFRLEETRRNPRDKANQASWTLSNDAYSCERHALRDFVDEDTAQNADPAIDPYGDTTQILTDKLLLRREYDAAQLLFNATNMAGSTEALAGVTQWSDNTSDPIKAIETKRGIIQRVTGARPNTLILGYDVYAALKQHTVILNAIKYTNTAIVTKEMLAALFEVDEVIVGGASRNTATEGQTESMSYIWGKYALLANIAKRPALKQLSLAYAFQSKPFQAKRYTESGLEGEWVEVEEKRDQKLVAAEAGYLWSAAVA